MTRVRKIYKTWYKNNKCFFRFGNLKEDQLQEAKQSLMTTLRQNNVSITEAQLALQETSQIWDIVVYVVSYFTGSISGAMVTPTYTWIAVILGGCVGILALYYPLKALIQKSVKDINSSGNTLLTIALESYQDIYNKEMNRDAKLTVLYNKCISVPCNAEELYEQKMRNSKYYRNAYLVSIHTRNQKFEYIWYTNTSYKKLNPHAYQKFLDTCEEQIGMKWEHINKMKIEFQQLE